MEVNVAALQYAYLNLVYRLFLTKLLLEIIQSAQTTETTPPEQNHTQGERYRYITDGNNTQGERYRYITDDNHTQGERYRYITDGNDALGTHPATGESTGTTRYTGINVTLYGRGEAVAMNYTASMGSRGGAAYLGKDILGSVRSTSNEYGLLEDRYEYDAFGKPYKGDLINGMNLGYTGKPYDATTGLYNYGYRDYQPVNAGFTTVDPIRDGNNWVSYVNNDPINWVDPWRLKGNSDSNKGVDMNFFPVTPNKDDIEDWATKVPNYGDTFVVGGHGSATSFEDSNRVKVPAQDLAAQITSHPNYKDGQTVTLLSCNTGNTSVAGNNTYAQQLADALGQGAKVEAPDNYVWYYSDGSKPVIAPYKDPNDESKGADRGFLGSKEGQMNTFTGAGEVEPNSGTTETGKAGKKGK